MPNFQRFALPDVGEGLTEADIVSWHVAVGDTVTVTVPDGSSREYRITGVLADMGSLLKADVYGMVLTEDGFRQIADENAQTGTTFRVQFKDGVNIQEAMNEIKAQYGLSDSQVRQILHDELSKVGGFNPTTSGFSSFRM